MDLPEVSDFAELAFTRRGGVSCATEVLFGTLLLDGDVGALFKKGVVFT